MILSNYSSLVASYTLITTATTTGADGIPTTHMSTRTTELPVDTVTPDPGDGLTGNDKIALGVGLGIGIPTLVLMVVGIWLSLKQWKLKAPLLKASPPGLTNGM
jgi:hypothetical protein